MIHNFSEIIQYSCRSRLWFIFVQTQFSSLFFRYFSPGKWSSMENKNKFVIWSTLKWKSEVANWMLLLKNVEIATSDNMIISTMIESLLYKRIPFERLVMEFTTLLRSKTVEFKLKVDEHQTRELHWELRRRFGNSQGASSQRISKKLCWDVCVDCMWR
jgi:hypothetical protein